MSSNLGLLSAACAFILWGILPVYWKLLQGVPAFEILCHRMFWSLIVTVTLVVFLGRSKTLLTSLRNRSNLLIFTTTAILLAINWLLYIWAVNAGYIIEASLGYFINPLINVLFGMIFFGERMRVLQWFALSLALAGVLYLTFYYGKFSWIAIVLGISFATYGLLHKKNSMAALDGLCLETGMLFVPAAALLFFLEIKGSGHFTSEGLHVTWLLAGAGLITTAPLLLFGFAAKRIPLSTLGLLQYMSPTINLLLGYYVYGEEFPFHRLVGFALIWGALFLYLTETIIRRIAEKRRALISNRY
jgi:chloramphenicol-sensitive protein RarD